MPGEGGFLCPAQRQWSDRHGGEGSRRPPAAHSQLCPCKGAHYTPIHERGLWKSMTLDFTVTLNMAFGSVFW